MGSSEIELVPIAHEVENYPVALHQTLGLSDFHPSGILIRGSRALVFLEAVQSGAG
jgi:hypothetical protein